MNGSANLIHLNRRHHAGKDALLFQSILQGQRVDHRCQHAHLIGGDAVHFLGLLGHAAKEISAADDDGDVNAQRLHIRQFGRNFVDSQGIHAETLIGRQGLTGQLEQNAFEGRSVMWLVTAMQKKPQKGCRSSPANHCRCFASRGLVVVNAMVAPASPTLKRAKRRTAMFSPSLPIFAAISCAMEIV